MCRWCGGAACAMRLLESTEVPTLRGAVLVATAYTDLGDESERRSEYFNRPWNWEMMKNIWKMKKIVGSCCNFGCHHC